MGTMHRERENVRRYEELVSKYGEDSALEKLNGERRHRVVYMALREEEEC